MADENRLKNYIDCLGDGIDSLPDVCEENYANWQADFDFSGVNQLVLPEYKTHCEELGPDAFNGAGYDYVVSFDNDEKYAKIFIPKTKFIGKHAFWQTGFRIIDCPKCENVMISAFEENDLLQVIRLKALNGKAKILQNPQLRNICIGGKLKSEEELENAVCGSSLIETTSLDNESGEPGDE